MPTFTGRHASFAFDPVPPRTFANEEKSSPGHGSPFRIWLPSEGRTSAQWRDLVSTKTELTGPNEPPVCDVLIDWPGASGVASYKGWRSRIEDLAEDLLGLLGHLGCSKCHVVGHSMGAMVGLEMCRQAPVAVASLTMVGSSVGGFYFPRLTLETIWDLLLGLAHERSGVSSFLQTESAVKPRRLLEVLRLMRVPKKASSNLSRHEKDLPDYSVLMKHVRMLARYSPGVRIADVKVPTLVIAGTHDRVCPPYNSLMLHELMPRSSLVMIKGASHVCESMNPVGMAHGVRLFHSLIDQGFYVKKGIPRRILITESEWPSASSQFNEWIVDKNQK